MRWRTQVGLRTLAARRALAGHTRDRGLERDGVPLDTAVPALAAQHVALVASPEGVPGGERRMRWRRQLAHRRMLEELLRRCTAHEHQRHAFALTATIAGDRRL